MRGKHVLLVEPNREVADTISDMLTSLEFRITIVDGGGAMRLAADGLDHVDAVVMDATLKGETAASLAIFLGELGVPLVMISGSPPEIEFARSYRLQLLAKPFGRDDLQAAMAIALSVSAKAGQRGTD